MKIKKSKKYVIVPQQFHPNQIGEMSMFCVVIKENKLDELFEFIVDNGGRVISAIPCHGVPKNSFDKLVDGFVNNEYMVISMCQKEIVDILMISLCREFKFYKKGNGKAFVIDVLGYMGAKGPFVEWGDCMEKKLIEKFYEEGDIFSEENYKLIFTSVRRGFEGEVLEAAKLEGHSGAVVMQAKAVEKVRKRFFGFSIDPESSVVLMLVKEDIVLPVIKSIYSAVDFKSEARGMLFVLPVSLVCGMDEIYENIDII